MSQTIIYCIACGLPRKWEVARCQCGACSWSDKPLSKPDRTNSWSA